MCVKGHGPLTHLYSVTWQEVESSPPFGVTICLKLCLFWQSKQSLAWFTFFPSSLERTDKWSTIIRLPPLPCFFYFICFCFCRILCLCEQLPLPKYAWDTYSFAKQEYCVSRFGFGSGLRDVALFFPQAFKHGARSLVGLRNLPEHTLVDFCS